MTRFTTAKPNAGQNEKIIKRDILNRNTRNRPVPNNGI